MSKQPTITEQLFAKIADGEVRAKVGLIVELCVAAITHLDSLDQEIFKVSRAAEARQGDGLPSKEELERLSLKVLEGVRALASYLEHSAAVAEQEAVDEEGGLDFDFDLGGPKEVPVEVTLDDDDIASALDGLAPQSKKSSDERWAALSSELTTLSYALKTQLDELDERFARALEQRRIPQALRELDDTGNALIDGVFALMSTICETYLDTFDRDQMLPGHRDALGKALLVRRGIADLRRAVKAVNGTIQDAAAPEDERRAGIDAIAAALSVFVESEVWWVMRPADRLELQNFEELLADELLREAALCCEGLDKYLDSLLSVNHRDVLIRHDREVMAEIAATLEGVGPIVAISPHGAVEMVREAFDKARALYGYQDVLDALLAEWRESVTEQAEPQAVVAIGKRLAALMVAATR